MEKRLSWEEKWEITRSKGKWRYIMRQALLWALILTVLGMGSTLIKLHFIEQKEIHFDNVLEFLPFMLLLFSVMGVYFGKEKWERHEKHFQQWKQQQK